MPVVPVESTVCVWVKIRGFGVVKEKKKKKVASVSEQGKHT